MAFWCFGPRALTLGLKAGRHKVLRTLDFFARYLVAIGLFWALSCGGYRVCNRWVACGGRGCGSVPRFLAELVRGKGEEAT